MMENNNPVEKSREEYREMARGIGKKEFTLLKMQEYGFWPEHLPTPYERKKDESKEVYEKREKLIEEYKKLADQIVALYKEKGEIDSRLSQLRSEYSNTWNPERIRKDIAQKIMQESIIRRKERKKQREEEKIQISEAWKKRKAEHIVFIGKGYSGLLSDQENDDAKLSALGLPIIQDDKALAEILEIEYKELRFLAYHRDVVITDHYHRYAIPKRSGGERNIAAPKPLLKSVQRKILSLILEKIEIADWAHGFLKGKSVVSGAEVHNKQPNLLINMDLENFFPTLTYERVRGMFKSFGYSGYISSILAMLCTYCERMPMEIKGQIRYIKISGRILPQGSPASPMITNIICRKLDIRMGTLAGKYPFTYSRYADDMSFGFAQHMDRKEIAELAYEIEQNIRNEGFKINKEKTRYLKKNNRQCITGIVINNNQIGVPKVWLKRMRAAIYNGTKLKENGKLPAHTANEIAGMASWLTSVNNERYQKMIDQAKKLLRE